jgi:diamine N-acetyltransferase
MEKTPHIRIRFATIADNTLLAKIGAETFTDTFGPDNTAEDMADYCASSFNPEKLAVELMHPETRFLIAEEDGAGGVAGYVKIKFGMPPPVISGKKVMEIGRLYARKAWIGKGVGARLMEASLAEAKKAGCDVVWLDVWEKNPRAIAFYEKWGFAKVGTQVFQLGADLQNDWLMEKVIA